ncbi:DUF3426 domain-containing protein [Nitrosospira sp. Is2]|uniref:DUF3426 domain-containing protein n=1 Tax=Nitrosospira sp. Is2 TaxID=3080532 RepID=UPI002954D5AD|nr:DUF3426 domain-containing protein [Nitrosospira sp. Is2]WON75262.1 DUF3426 domain-containing protein [Nitrosospira sp. Is2]
MALITRCPSCAAAFRVTPLDLQAHGGDVRCGRCGQIFNGYSMLATGREPEAAEPSPSEAEQPAQGAASGARIAGRDDGSEPALSKESSVQSDVPLRRRDESIQEEVTAEEPHAQATAPPLTSAERLAAEQPVAGEALGEAPWAREPVIKDEEAANRASDSSIGETAGREEPVWRPEEADTQAQEDLSDEDYSPRPNAFEKAQPRLHTIVWTVGTLFLLFVLAAQATYFYRAELAFSVPAAKPYLERYCELLDCTVRLPQRTKSLNIESSDMQSDTQRPGVITLNATVRNHASYPQAFPLFQLTLIDAKDRPLASRTFLPEAYLGHKVGAADAIAPNDEINISLHLDSGNLNAAGYRLSLLYPGS